MRGAFLMCLLALCATLSYHYLRIAQAARGPGVERSDPVTSMGRAYPVSFEDWESPESDTLAATDVQ